MKENDKWNKLMWVEVQMGPGDEGEFFRLNLIRLLLQTNLRGSSFFKEIILI